MSSKKFIYIFITVTFLFVFINTLIWNFATKKIFYTKKDFIVGDIARLAYDPGVIINRKAEILTLKKQHTLFNNKSNKKIDMLTFGDSFSRGGAGGKNPYYQDFIATYNNINVAHVHNFKKHYNCVNTLLIMINSGIIDEIKPKYILLESAQRECIKRLGIDLDFQLKYNRGEIKDFYSAYPDKPFNTVLRDPVKFINSGNLKYLIYNLLYNFNDKAYFSKVYRIKVNGDYFSEPYMLIYNGDIKSGKIINDKSIKKLNTNLNKIGKILKEKNIKFFFMPAPDKYTLYYKFFHNKDKYPSNNFYELLRKEPKDNYIFIDTLKILSKEINNRVSDIYYKDDTHWTNKASKAIFEKTELEQF